MIAGAAALYVVIRLLGLHRFFANDAEGIGALLQIVGTLYSVVYAFAIYVIWGQFTAVENEVLKESGALKDLLVFSHPFKESERDVTVRAVRTYARAVAETEWGSLSAGGRSDKTDKLFIGIISSITEMNPEHQRERVLHQQLLEIANQASCHRDERLAVSIKRMPRTLRLFVSFAASTILFLLLLLSFRNLLLGALSVAIATALLYFAHFVLTDLDNPFEGTWNISAEPFAELATKFR
jgi:hypothetical protein